MDENKVLRNLRENEENRQDQKEAAMRREAFFAPGTLPEDSIESLNKFIQKAPTGSKILEYIQKRMIISEATNKLLELDRLLNQFGRNFEILATVNDEEIQRQVVGLIKDYLNEYLGPEEKAQFAKQLEDILES